jgi:HrpA-like RNA helicase
VLAQSVDDDSPFSNPREALKNALQPPENSAIDAALEELESYGAIEIEDDEEKDGTFDRLQSSYITELGKFMSHIPLDIRLARFVALGARAGKYIMHTIVLAVGISMQDVFVRPYPFAEPEEFLKLV